MQHKKFLYLQVIAARQAQLSAASEDRIADMEIKTMMEVMGRFRQLSPDGTECGCLKAIVLFKPGERVWITRTMVYMGHREHHLARQR